jgi:AcrR family transcriptional regulator
MQKRSLETRQRIMEAALDCFARDGYTAAGVAEICKKAGISKGAFYHHFPTKQAVFLALLQNWLKTIDTYLNASRASTKSAPDAIQMMTTLMGSVFAQAGGWLPMFLEFWTQAGHDPLVWQALMEPYRHYTRFFQELIQQGIDEGSFRQVDREIAARTIVSLALGLLLQGLLDTDGAQWDQVTGQAIAITLKGLSA